MDHDTLIVLDYGSQTSQLIARRLRERGVYAELFPWHASPQQVMALEPKGFILSGGPNSVYAPGAPSLPAYVTDSGLPILGICYGMQLLTHTAGGVVAPAAAREYGPAVVELGKSRLWEGLPARLDVWMSHGDRIEKTPDEFITIGASTHSPVAAMSDPERGYYGVQFHPEVTHTPLGSDILANFAVEICQCRPDWTPEAFIDEAISAIQGQVGDGRVLLGLSGGVDSAVVASLAHRAIGDRLVSVYIDHGMMRQGETEGVIATFKEGLGLNLIAVDASGDFLAALAGVTDPENKRVIIGEQFVRAFEREAARLGQFDFLAQGTIYPDVIESAAPDRPDAQRIKTHHNVGGLPPTMTFTGVVEPLRYLFKDEVRRVGEALGLPASMVWRQPFPGPGLAIRCLGEITRERLARLREADAILREELEGAGMLRGETAQAFAVLLPVRSVGVQGDGRTYGETVVLRAVATDDFMTADWARLPYDLLAKISARVTNEVAGVNRVVYDITSKPPATIEWE